MMCYCCCAFYHACWCVAICPAVHTTSDGATFIDLVEDPLIAKRLKVILNLVTHSGAQTPDTHGPHGASTRDTYDGRDEHDEHGKMDEEDEKDEELQCVQGEAEAEAGSIQQVSSAAVASADGSTQETVG